MKHSLFGNVTFSVIGAYGEEFITALIQQGIVLKNIRSKGGIIYADASKQDYLIIARTSRNFGVRTRVCKRKGIYFRVRCYRSRFGLVIGSIAGLFLILILQRFIWKIEVHGNEKLSENQVIQLLSLNNVEIGSYSPAVDVNAVEVDIKRRIPDIAWMSVELNGSKLSVYINEADFPETPVIPQSTPCNVVAAKSGVILETQVYSGTLLYPKGSGVAEGSVVVSGAVDDVAGNISITHANAKIIAEFTETVEFFMPYTTMEKQKTGLVEYERELMLFGFVFPLDSENIDRANKICTEETQAFELFGLKLPWTVKTNTYTEYEDISVTRKSSDIERILTRQLDDYCENFFGEYELVNTRKSIRADETGVYLHADVILRGNIAVQREIMQKNVN